MDFETLLKKACEVLGSRKVARNTWVRSVASALISESGKVYPCVKNYIYNWGNYNGKYNS